ncbi:hypothetical protein [Nocardia seriolae]|uniref:Uncharacterized protein n=1 Tax=Nocardia seriolae TaxID=37332 RepID=A0A0B8NFA7_9NOCA|nr:hypothetical protein [Nocardia seriolae]APB00307.1 hypothetical protein NS506_06271 [Nocardia seriolae]MTJ64976.1 hypothetical protein [Nocardia seriolae]MTJ71830.1 hypothetical protein [Nocardia seriolae]MTJ89790.1 hypothetical protein [Nocardia seriolae]MTK33766.1 hypothetical protein [Nocardia seriolae]
MSDQATLHLEYLYGPQWNAVLTIVEQAGQLTAEQRERLNTAAAKAAESQLGQLQNAASGTGGLSGLSGLSGLLSGLGQQGTSQPLQIATRVAKEFGRARNTQIAAAVAGQAMSPGAGAGDIAGILQSLGSLGAVSVLNQAVTAAVLADLVGRGEFTEDVYAELMRPWREGIGA